MVRVYLFFPLHTLLICRYMHLSCVPAEMKTARVIPLFENTSKTDPDIYCPVFILNIISNILEGITYNQTDSYIKSDFFYSFQYGFRRVFSTNIPD